MQICDNGHSEIAHNDEDCPLCLVLDQMDSMKEKKIRQMENNIVESDMRPLPRYSSIDPFEHGGD